MKLDKNLLLKSRICDPIPNFDTIMMNITKSLKITILYLYDPSNHTLPFWKKIPSPKTES